MANNPQAYPCLDSDGFGLSMRNPGMTLRDWFAGQMMTNLGTFTVAECDDDTLCQIAEQVYRMADAMLAAREKNDDLSNQNPS